MDEKQAGKLIDDVLADARGVASARAKALSPEEVEALGKTVCDALDGDRINFMSPLTIAVVPKAAREGRRLSVILKPFIYMQRKKKRSFAVLAPPEYETDFASIPAGARWLIAPFGKHAEAAVIHDWLYVIGNAGDEYERRHADMIFREAMKYLGVNFFLRWIMYLTVRLGGKRAFGRADELRFRNLESLEPEQDRIGREVWRKFTTCWHEGK